MKNPIKRIDKALKTKDDMQNFVLVTLILFVMFVKCYMVLTTPEASNTPNSQHNVEVVETAPQHNI